MGRGCVHLTSGLFLRKGGPLSTAGRARHSSTTMGGVADSGSKCTLLGSGFVPSGGLSKVTSTCLSLLRRQPDTVPHCIHARNLLSDCLLMFGCCLLGAMHSQGKQRLSYALAFRQSICCACFYVCQDSVDRPASCFLAGCHREAGSIDVLSSLSQCALLPAPAGQEWGASCCQGRQCVPLPHPCRPRRRRRLLLRQAGRPPIGRLCWTPTSCRESWRTGEKRRASSLGQ